MGVLVVGSINVDRFVRLERLPRPGETVLGADAVTMPGGKGANQAVAAARAGAQVRLVGCVGGDDAAPAALAGLRAAGVDLTGVRVVDRPTGVAWILAERGGENAIVVQPGANAEVRAPRVGPSEVVVLQGEVPAGIVDEVAAAAEAAGARVVLNLAPVVDVTDATLAVADPLVVNESERAALGERVGLARSLLTTLGADGSVVTHDGVDHRVPAAPAQVVDTTGAGDAFVGGLAAALAGGASLTRAAEAGARSAAEAVGREGAQPDPSEWAPWDSNPQPAD